MTTEALKLAIRDGNYCDGNSNSSPFADSDYKATGGGGGGNCNGNSALITNGGGMAGSAPNAGAGWTTVSWRENAGLATESINDDKTPSCFGSNPSSQERAENDCDECHEYSQCIR